MENKKQRKLIIMQSLAGMLEERELMKITTAELAKRSEITEAAIYKHFPSKRKIFEELVVFFEESIFSRINGIKEETKADDMVQMNTPYTKTVEEEVIDNMLPLVGPPDNTDPSYKPVLDDNIESSKL